MTVKAPEETRRRILKAAFEEFHHNGFQGASINRIVTSAGITKGALFHHFTGKQALGYAVVDEVLKPLHHERWVQPLSRTKDPIRELKRLLSCFREDLKKDPGAILNGCPVNNLAQEMSPLDEGFRQRLESILEAWRGAVAQAIARGIEDGRVRPDVSPAATAVFLVSAFEGIIGSIKSSQSIELAKHAARGFFDYLDSLAPKKTGKTANR